MTKSLIISDAEIREKLGQIDREHIKDLTLEIDKDMVRIKERQIER
ncbi:hypothetical protein RB2150_18397 [Rhodobacterales bacterium HTCC2150]|nr:hypothetical protein RB2150_17797 [Rhodobacterales bacterium HTCC2150] [Rhodobacteraceae bacterium HTCC2150]EBA02764.1 hypothetical protein RB2150_17957 [Rhodobacterales bacterium HTCC2150] [Rhodobacteraceae bacterium HTCC2150]EBA02852.1 hypothetical protein RB2150_18397 [Rhodobacterales bacterium HTCC2150] [Rhodobacteraceae bacterium HTCC2150]